MKRATHPTSKPTRTGILGGGPAVYAIFFLSGVSGLGYEIVWTRMFAAGLGHEMPGVLAVVGAFFGGLAIGAWALDGLISRSRVPGRWYAGLELAIAAWAVTSIALIPLLNELAASLIGVRPSATRHWLVALAVPLVGLLPATAAMGATLPAMERLASRLRGRGSTVAGVYAMNTAGAVAGTLATTFLIAPRVGYQATLLALAAVNVVCAAATLIGPGRGESQRPEVVHEMDDPPTRTRLGVTIFATGLLGIGYEVLGVRVMAQVLENTVYSFASALSVYLLGTAIGAAAYQRLASKRRFAVPLLWLLQCLALACILGVIVMGESGAIYERLRRLLGGGALGAVGAELGLAALVFGPPTVLMGAVFGHLIQAARGREGGVGLALSLNTLGGALAPVLFGVVSLSSLGTKWTLVVVSLGYLLLLPLRQLRLARLRPAAAALALVMVLPSSLLLIDAPPGQQIVVAREGIMATVAVIEDQQQPPRRLLKVNNRFFMGGNVRSFADRRQAHMPLLLHPNPRRALFLGVGTGITAGAATVHPQLEVTAVELLPEVVELLPRFAPDNRLERFDREQDLIVADARRFVRSASGQYDVIVADLFHPARDGAGALYTLEHFSAVRARLADGGLFCQWLPLYQLDMQMVRLIVRTFLEAFPYAEGYLAHFNVETPMLGLIGSEQPRRYPADWYARRVVDPELVDALTPLALSNELTLFGCRLADRAGLEQVAGPGPLNTDGHPRVIFRAPMFMYTEPHPPYGRLVELLDDVATPLAASAGSDDDASDDRLVDKLDAYRAARNLYLRGAVAQIEGRSGDATDEYLSAVRASPDFRTAYVMCLKEALDRRVSDPARAREILLALREANPADPRATQFLRQIR